MIDLKKDCRIKEDGLKTLSPTLRVKKRFIKIQIKSDKKENFEMISKKINDTILFFMGAIDYSKSGFWILKDKFDFEKQELVLRVGVEYRDKLVTSISLIKDLKVEIIRISGTLKGLEKKD